MVAVLKGTLKKQEGITGNEQESLHAMLVTVRTDRGDLLLPLLKLTTQHLTAHVHCLVSIAVVSNCQ